jgi:hypothetical protein
MRQVSASHFHHSAPMLIPLCSRNLLPLRPHACAMNDSADTAYSHEPLPDSKTHIRLLKILQGGFEKHVVCEMSAWPIAIAPPYDAISYTLGDPNSTAMITINGRQMMVRQNCEYALQQVSAARWCRSRHFWLDALCICQVDTKEKNHQVAMMGQLYKQAECVHACVGPHAMDSEYIFEVVREHAPILKRMNEKGVLRDDGFVPLAGRCFNLGSARLEIRASLLMGAKARCRLLQSFIAFVGRPYFQRLWILQELYLASETSFHCGNSDESGDILVTLSHLIEMWTYPSHRWLHDKKTKRFRLFEMTTRHSCFRRRRKSCLSDREYLERYDCKARLACLTLASSSPSTMPLRLVDIIRNMTEFDCADPRDKLYGILNLVHRESEVDLPIPDYEKDTFSIVTELLSTADREGISLAFILDIAITFIRSLNVPCDLDRFDQAWEGFSVPVAFGHDAREQHNAKAPSISSRPNIAAGKLIRAWHESNKRESRQEGTAFVVEGPMDGCTPILNERGEVHIYGPPGTAIGDWLLPLHIPGKQGIGLVVRQTGHDRLCVVGVANYMYDPVVDDIAHYSLRCNLQWHPMELQILATVLAPIDHSATDPKILNKILNNKRVIRLEHTHAIPSE